LNPRGAEIFQRDSFFVLIGTRNAEVGRFFGSLLYYGDKLRNNSSSIKKPLKPLHTYNTLLEIQGIPVWGGFLVSRQVSRGLQRSATAEGSLALFIRPIPAEVGGGLSRFLIFLF
jgi:hypothetical protein